MSKEVNEIKQILVKGSSPVRELAGSIIKSYEGGDKNIELRAIGAGSVNQMYKALATARSIFAQKGLDMAVRPGYDEVVVDGNKRTVMVARLVVE